MKDKTLSYLGFIIEKKEDIEKPFYIYDAGGKYQGKCASMKITKEYIKALKKLNAGA